MTSYWIKFTAIFIVAATLILTGFSIAWYPHYQSEILRLTLEQNSLTEAQRYDFEGGLNWWNNIGVYLYESIGNSVLIVGILVLLYAIIYLLTSIWRESKSIKNVEMRPTKLSYLSSGWISTLNRIPF
jgi:type IV secretory pathway TraG/TraD family ATPase VirD4